MYVRLLLVLIATLGMGASAMAQAVDLALHVTDGASGQRELRFGLDPSATPGIDPHLGEAELPPFPPAGVLEARFVGDGIGIPEMGLGTYRDYRPGTAGFEGSVAHRLRYQTGDGSAITLSWDWPAGVTGRLQDIVTGSLIDVELAGAGSYTVTNPDGFSALDLTITYSGSGASGPAVDLPLIVSDGVSGQRSLRLGLDPSATPGIDPHLGEAELPPFPPAGVLEARFVGDGIGIPELGLGSYRDYRPGSADFQGTVVHRLRFQRGDGAAITLSWNWPSGVTGRLQDIITGNLIDVSMSGSGSYTVANPDGFNTLDLTVTYAGNEAPVFVSQPVTQAMAFEAYAYQVIATDPDGGALTITAPSLPSWLTLTDNGDGTALLAGTPTNDDAGDHAVTLLASDGILTTEQSFTVTVAYVNQAPEFVSEPVTEATAFEEYVYQVVATDPDGDALTITASTLPAWLTLTDNGDGTALLAGTPTNDDAGDVPVTLVVSDGELVDEQIVLDHRHLREPGPGIRLRAGDRRRRPSRSTSTRSSPPIRMATPSRSPPQHCLRGSR
jgi:hypothetical protein